MFSGMAAVRETRADPDESEKKRYGYILQQRIERAKQCLRDPRRSILDAGLDAGFQNTSHFARMFRKVEGISPSRFRADYAPRSTLTQTAA